MDPASSAEYLEKHGIKQLFENLMQQLVVHKPNDPLEFLVNQLQRPVIHRLIVLGGPASGKGTVCEELIKKYQVVHLSPGDILRDAIREGTELGKKTKPYLESGQLVPDEVMIPVIVAKLKQVTEQSKGWLLDGFPRTRNQALGLQEAGFFPDAVISLNIGVEIALQRVEGRRIDPVTKQVYHLKYNPPHEPAVRARLIQRADDSEEKLRKRFVDYDKYLLGIRDCYPHNYHSVDASKNRDEVASQVDSIVSHSKGASSSSGHL